VTVVAGEAVQFAGLTTLVKFVEDETGRTAPTDLQLVGVASSIEPDPQALGSLSVRLGLDGQIAGSSVPVGRYRPSLNQIAIREGEYPQTLLASLLVHEITHAVDDHHTSYGASLASLTIQRDTDRNTALRVVAEGRAVFVQSAWLSLADKGLGETLPTDSSRQPPQNPATFRTQLVYREGGALIQRMGLSSSEDLLFDPPTTREILFPIPVRSSEAHETTHEASGNLSAHSFGAIDIITLLAGSTDSFTDRHRALQVAELVQSGVVDYTGRQGCGEITLYTDRDDGVEVAALVDGVEFVDVIAAGPQFVVLSAC